ncbi:hypothetical protein TrispH2_008804 [Trichoplax sp. H2]|nr:hypothetical protein TrispH2_008804 [Trichoplax sp. H2]|eukprot:RDD39947.1 hypothetical protein TrispH2_008804 [Trichoplax sp. H2]
MMQVFRFADVLQPTKNSQCKAEEYINVMGSGCQDCRVDVAQNNGFIFTVHGQLSRTNCGMTVIDEKGQDLDMIDWLLGYYDHRSFNPSFRCQNGPEATSIWFVGLYQSP